ncbi:hypothetical protein [Dactylosporangium sp. CA-233914]|uniref:hypothetical protein n=1 Tax=Dactylosporangium sp. CA-233914 TaxID=3239934 RepID=UPI003D9240A2
MSRVLEDSPSHAFDLDDQLTQWPPDPARPLRTTPWFGIAGLAGAVVLAAIVIPSRIYPDDGRFDTSPAGVTPPGTPIVPTAAAPSSGVASPPTITAVIPQRITPTPAATPRWGSSSIPRFSPSTTAPP